MDIFSTYGSQTIHVKIIDLRTRRCIALRDDEMYKLILQIAAYESMEESHPGSWSDILSCAFSLKQIFPDTKYILLTKHCTRITLDKQCISTLMDMKSKFRYFVDKLASRQYNEFSIIQ